MIINIVNKPISSKVIVGVTMISIELGIILCSRFSTMLNNQTAKITPIIPPCPAARCSPVKIFLIGFSSVIPVSNVVPPITPPKPGVAPNTFAELITYHL